MAREFNVPVHRSLNVIDTKEIYKTDEWWKAVVRYQFDNDGEYDETAVYLWHNNGDWKRKNKYVIKTEEAWKTDKTVVNQLFTDEIISSPEKSLPVSDYYEIGAGKTIFQSNGWWKAILKVVQKGSYDTEEIMIYLWQQSEDGWRRRQKFAISDQNSWEEEIKAVEAVLNIAFLSGDKDEDTKSRSRDKGGQVSEFDQLNREMDKHLSDARSE